MTPDLDTKAQAELERLAWNCLCAYASVMVILQRRLGSCSTSLIVTASGGGTARAMTG